MNYETLNDNANTQFELSHELLHFLGWLLEQEQEHKMLKSIIKRSLVSGLKNKKSIQKEFSVEDIQSLQYNLVEFFVLLDTLLYEAIHEKNLQKVAQKNLTKTIQQIDGTLCNSAIVEDSIAKITDEIERSPEKNAKTVLYETLLKKWRPDKRNETH